jgi:hypothetical protein
MQGSTSRAGVIVIAAFISVAAEAAPAPLAHLDLVWVDPAGVARGTFAAVSAESRAVLRSLDAEVEWTQADHGVVVGPESMVVIALPSFTQGTNRARHVMGATRAVAEGGLAVWVFPDQVAWALGLDLDARPSWTTADEVAFARGLARVASHEIVHALGVAAHAHQGLMSPSLDRTALLNPALEIDRRTVKTVRRLFDRAFRAGGETPSLAALRPGLGAAAARTPPLAAMAANSPGGIR